MDEAVYGVWLQLVLGEGSRKVPSLLDYFGSCRVVYDSDRVERHLCGLLTEKEIRKMEATPLDEAEEIMEACGRLHYDVLTPDSDRFPLRLRNIPDYPAALYSCGSLPDFDREVCIGVVGTRRASRNGYQTASVIARELSACGAIVISGGARGIDTASHQGALIGGSPTVAVLGCGINTRYNMGNDGLRKVIASSGALLSEYPPGSPPLTHHFPVRNRLISALSLGVVVVEAGVKSGSLITANLALEQGKDLFAVPGEVGNVMALGTNRLISDGAKPVTGAADVLEEYVTIFPHRLRLENIRNDSRVFDKGVRPKWERTPPAEKPASSPEAPPEPKSGRKSQSGTKSDSAAFPVKMPEPPRTPVPPVGMSPNAAKVFVALDASPRTLDEIAAATGLTASDVMKCMTELELFGAVQSLAGRRYARR